RGTKPASPTVFSPRPRSASLRKIWSETAAPTADWTTGGRRTSASAVVTTIAVCARAAAVARTRAAAADRQIRGAILVVQEIRLGMLQLQVFDLAPGSQVLDCLQSCAGHAIL